MLQKGDPTKMKPRLELGTRAARGSANVSARCRRFGIGRTTDCKLSHGYNAAGTFTLTTRRCYSTHPPTASRFSSRSATRPRPSEPWILSLTLESCGSRGAHGTIPGEAWYAYV